LPPRADRFYTGLVADLSVPLRSSIPDPEPYAAFVAACGEPALELGCGHGEPLIALRTRGLDVEGLDSSPDMLELCRRSAADAGIDVVLHESPMESMGLGRLYRSIYLAGPTFNLLPDDDTARAALARIAAHLEPGGSVLVPLFVPEPTDVGAIGVPREGADDEGRPIRFTPLEVSRDEDTRVQRSVLRYERGDEVVERTWTLHWHTQGGFRALAEEAGLTAAAVMDPGGGAAAADATSFVFILTH
jgi:SAM-dependent methyltransferase